MNFEEWWKDYNSECIFNKSAKRFARIGWEAFERDLRKAKDDALEAE